MATSEKYKKGYKVVFTTDNISKCSAVICYNGAVVYYKINKWAKPNKGFGSLCVFNTLENALNFVSKTPTLHIYECLYESSNENEVYLALKKIHSVFLKFLPYGTELASKVKLIRRVR